MEGKSEEDDDELYFSGQLLDNECTLDDYGIQTNSTLYKTNSITITIWVSSTGTSKRKIIELEARGEETILSIKHRIQASEGVAVDQYTLFHEGMALNDDKTLSSVGICGDTTLFLDLGLKANEIYLKARIGRGECVKMNVDGLLPIRYIKVVLGQKIGYPLDEYEVLYNGEKLDDMKALSSYEVGKRCKVDVELGKIQIFVKYWKGNSVSLYISPHKSVKKVMYKVCERLMEPVALEAFYVMYDGKVLGNDQELAGVGVENDSTLSMMFRAAPTFRPITIR